MVTAGTRQPYVRDSACSGESHLEGTYAARLQVNKRNGAWAKLTLWGVLEMLNNTRYVRPRSSLKDDLAVCVTLRGSAIIEANRASPNKHGARVGSVRWFPPGTTLPGPRSPQMARVRDNQLLKSGCH